MCVRACVRVCVFHLVFSLVMIVALYFLAWLLDVNLICYAHPLCLFYFFAFSQADDEDFMFYVRFNII